MYYFSSAEFASSLDSRCTHLTFGFEVAACDLEIIARVITERKDQHGSVFLLALGRSTNHQELGPGWVDSLHRLLKELPNLEIVELCDIIPTRDLVDCLITHKSIVHFRFIRCEFKAGVGKQLMDTLAADGRHVLGLDVRGQKGNVMSDILAGVASTGIERLRLDFERDITDPCERREICDRLLRAKNLKDFDLTGIPDMTDAIRELAALGLDQERAETLAEYVIQWSHQFSSGAQQSAMGEFALYGHHGERKKCL